MPNVLVHYAMGVGIASAWSKTRRARWAWATLAVLPDLDGLTNATLQPTLQARAWSPPSAQTITLFLAHRGILHTLTFAIIIAIIAWLASRNVRAMMLALALVASHVLLDMMGSWPVHPFLPFSGVRANVGLVPFNDVAATGFSLFALGGAIALDVRWTARVAPVLRMAPLAIAVMPFLVYGFLGAAAARAAPGEPNAYHFPEYQVVQDTGGGHFVHLVSVDGTRFERTDVPFIDDLDSSGLGEAVVARALCEYGKLGPLSWVAYPTFNVTRIGNDSWLVRITDARLVQDPTLDLPHVELTFDASARVTRVHAAPGGSTFHGEESLDLPGSVADHAACAPVP